MAHELKFNDNGQASMFYVGETPWHEEGVHLECPPTAAKAMKVAGLDWEVVKAPLFYHRSITDTAIVPKSYALVPGDGWTDEIRPVFGVVSDKYEILQNRKAFTFFDPLVSGSYATYETAGALGSGERLWVLVKLQGNFEIGRGDRIERYLLLANNHDGHGTVNVKFTPIRVVCQNTLSMALQDARQFFAIRHDKALGNNLGIVAAEMRARIESRYGVIQQQFLDMLEVEIRQEQAEAYFALVYADPGGPPPRDEYQARLRQARLKALARNRSNCMHILKNSPRCRVDDRPMTVWTAYNAVTENVDHWIPSGSRGRNPAVRLNDIWFGDGQRRKLRAFEEGQKLVGVAKDRV